MDHPPTAAADAALSHWAAQHPAATAAVPILADLTPSSGQASLGGRLGPAKACRARFPLFSTSTFFQ